ncbi:MAG: RDD family protein [Burkholderiales bacterium]|nr:RDD family protein [Burkholderiales bacterium]
MPGPEGAQSTAGGAPAPPLAGAPPAQGKAAGPAALRGVEYVGFGRRCAAAVIDFLVIFVVTFPLLYAVYGRQVFDTDRMLLGPVDFVVSYVFPAIYAVAFWRYKQATPGKMAISAIIVDARTGGRVPLARLVGRYFAYFISAVPLGLGFLWIAVDRKKQGWHDKIVRTLVIEEPF